MKSCALCRRPALLFCESDRASLCWDCDAKVHGANFLVARHTRCLLCKACQEPTPWKASGSQLGRTVSVCDGCANGNCDGEKGKLTAATVAVRGGVEVVRTAPTAAEVREERGRSSSSSSEEDDDDDLDGDDEDLLGEEDDDEEMGTDYDDEIGTDYDDDDDDDAPLQNEHDDDEDGDNQVVPWSVAAEDAATAPAAASATEPPPPSASSSSSDDADYCSYDYESASPGRGRTMRRMMMMRAHHDDDDGFDGAGLAKRRMLARTNAATNLAPTYHYQVC